MLTGAAADSPPPAIRMPQGPAERRWLRDRMGRRLTRLYAGLVLYGFSMGLQIRAGLGLDPWDVFHEGIDMRTPLSFGAVTIVVGAVVLLLWLPLHQRPGIGTLSNVVVIGLAVDATLAVLDAPDGVAARWALLIAGIGLNAAATACYIGAGLGPGPRDGLMTGWVRRYGGSVRLVRTTIEVTVLAVGWLLGGTVGVGTVLYAISIGPLVQLLLPRVTLTGPTAPRLERSGGDTPRVATQTLQS
jgi:uncharacterized membrane protein YczE